MILGLAHSGTTILDAALGASADMVGVGEAAWILDASRGATIGKRLRNGQAEEVACTCGCSAAECPVWKPVSRQLSKKEETGVTEGYELLRDAVHATHSDARILIDSTPAGIRYVDELKSIFDVCVILLSRDVRSWSASYQARKNCSALFSCLRWRRKTAELEQQIILANVPFIRLGYEEFATRPDEAFALICEWAGAQFDGRMVAPFGNTKSHIIDGNGRVRGAAIPARVQYDGSWLSMRRGAFVRGIAAAVYARHNARLVYSNGICQRKPKQNS